MMNLNVPVPLKIQADRLTARRLFSYLFLTTFLVCMGCSKNEPVVSTTKGPRAVKTIELSNSSPHKTLELTGSVGAWKTENIGFQVTGRVKTVVEPGTNIIGQTVDENGKVISQGSIIAELETDRYELAIASAKAKLETATAQAQAKESELTTVIPQRVNSAQASVVLARQEGERIKQLLKEAAVSEAQADKAREKLDTAEAELQQVKASALVAKAELDSLKAQAKEAQEAIRQAEKDLSDTTLLSAFNGQVGQVHEIPGSFVQAGERVVTVQMMDPIKVEISVSAETDSRLNYNDVVNIVLPQTNEKLQAMVYEKATLADAATRTFIVTLLVRNQNVEVGLPINEVSSETYRVRTMWNLFSEKADQSPPFYVPVDFIHEDAEGSFVWEVANRKLETYQQLVDSKLVLKKVRVKPGKKRIPFLQVFTMRLLEEHGDLVPNESLVVGDFFDAHGQPVEQKRVAEVIHDGDTVFYVRTRWKIRPGDIVRVQLPGDLPTPGFYIPADMILSQAGRNSVFVVDESNGNTSARQIPVNVFDQVGTTRRIEPVIEGAFGAGTRLVSEGALLLADGDAILIVETATMKGNQ